jgi:bacillithiol synthase
MESTCTFLTYQSTGYFSSIVTDYINSAAALQPFYNHAPTIEGIIKAIEERKKFATDRNVLVGELKNQYTTLRTSPHLTANINLLLSNNTFTITTAHQPNIFTGPLYFVYKILHTIKLAALLKEQLPQYNFVPTYYMGSEDADLDELGFININGVKHQWHTKQTGAVGRMLVDKPLLQLIDAVQGQIGVLENGNEISNLFRQCYTLGKSIQQATLELVNALFGSYGLVIVIPDNANLKRLFNDVVKKELQEQFSHKAVAETITELSKHYKVQAGGRELNLFYLLDDKRERIELIDSTFHIKSLKLVFTEAEILNELQLHPERFSANVILRGVFQETILPNIAFIGGGGEIAYWLELKKVFQAAQVPYPVLVLRNSFLLVDEKDALLLNKLQLNFSSIFKSEDELLNDITKRQATHQLTLNEELAKATALYNSIKQTAGTIDSTLAHHVEALETKAVYRLKELEKKMLRAEKRKRKDEAAQLHKLKSSLFPNNNLQERTENLSSFYGKFGKHLLDELLQQSLGLEQQFVVMELK